MGNEDMIVFHIGAYTSMPGFNFTILSPEIML
jgi:hypothetical protein